MSFWSSVAPMAGMVAGNMIAPGMGGAIGGAIGGALAGNARKQEQLKKQRQTSNASADAIAASWARRDGKGSIPEVQWASGDDDVLAGAVGGGMQGYAMKDMFAAKPADTSMMKDSMFGGDNPYTSPNMYQAPKVDWQSFGKTAPAGGAGYLSNQTSQPSWGLGVTAQNSAPKYGLR